MKPTTKDELWIEYLEGELPLEEYELRGSLLRRSMADRATVTTLETVRDAVKDADPALKFDSYLNDRRVQSRLHESIMQSVMTAPTKEKREATLLTLYSGPEKTSVLRKQSGRT